MSPRASRPHPLRWKSRLTKIVANQDPFWLELSDFWQGNQNIIGALAPLVDELSVSDAGAIPLAAIRFPHPFFYLALPEVRGISDLAVLEGCYLDTIDSVSLGLRVSCVFRDATGVEYCIGTCGPIEPSDTVESWTRRSIEDWRQLRELSYRGAGVAEADLEQQLLLPCLSIVFNLLAYLSTEPPLKVEWSSPPPKRLLEKLANGTRRQREVAKRDIEQLSILPIRVVGHDIAEAMRVAGAGLGVGVSPHWRRGHFHTYWTGPGRTIPQLKWVRPVIVNADQGEPTGIHVHPVDRDAR
jgi:hypothetical protein